MPAVVRVLKIPAGQTHDAQGRCVGDDWLLADMGAAEIDGRYVRLYLTTDRVHASEFCDLSGRLPLEPVALAEWIADELNALAEDLDQADLFPAPVAP